MGMIDIKYKDLYSSYKSVFVNVDELFSIIEKLNSEFQGLSGCWEGSLSDRFSGMATNIINYSNKVVLNLKNTEEYKNYVSNSFKNVEQKNMNDYKIT